MNRNDETVPRAGSLHRDTLLRFNTVPAPDTAAAHTQTKGTKL